MDLDRGDAGSGRAGPSPVRAKRGNDSVCAVGV